MLISRVIAPRTSRIDEVATPEPRAGQILIDVLASGVCTSDLGPWLRGPQGGDPIELGHETAGRVVAVGSPGSRWAVGDLVTGLGGSGFATQTLLDADSVLPIPTGLSPTHAIGEPIATLEEAISRTPIAPGARVAVVGLGFMGLGLVQLAKSRAPHTIIGVDPNPAARERALTLGVDAALHPDEVAAFVAGGAGGGAGGEAGRAVGAPDPRADVVLEATGVTPGLDTASPLVKPFGTLCIVGYHHAGTAKLDMELWYKGATVVNGFCPDRPRVMRAMDAALALVAARRFSYAPLVTHTMGLDRVDEAYELMDARDAAFVKAVIVP
jgi:threonine dehydrogenase-like Zn-dependent dehydrogenase